jgi:hypothetical protein
MGNLEGAIAYIITSPATWSILAYNINHTTIFKIRSSTLANAVSLLTGVKPRSASTAIGYYLNNEAWLKELGLSLVEHRTGGVHGNGIYIIQVVNREKAIKANTTYARMLGLTVHN